MEWPITWRSCKVGCSITLSHEAVYRFIVHSSSCNFRDIFTRKPKWATDRKHLYSLNSSDSLNNKTHTQDHCYELKETNVNAVDVYDVFSVFPSSHFRGGVVINNYVNLLCDTPVNLLKNWEKFIKYISLYVIDNYSFVISWNRIVFAFLFLELYVGFQI